MDVSQAQEAKQLRNEDARLRKLIADLSLGKDALQWVIENRWNSRSGRRPSGRLPQLEKCYVEPR